MASPLAVYLTRTGERPARFARRIGVHRSVVCRWVNGDRSPDTHSAVLIEKATDGAVPITSWVTVITPDAAPPPLERRKGVRTASHPRVTGTHS